MIAVIGDAGAPPVGEAGPRSPGPLEKPVGIMGMCPETVFRVLTAGEPWNEDFERLGELVGGTEESYSEL